MLKTVGNNVEYVFSARCPAIEAKLYDFFFETDYVHAK